MSWTGDQAGEWQTTSAASSAVTLVGNPVGVAATSAGGVRLAVAALLLAVAPRTREIITRNSQENSSDIFQVIPAQMLCCFINILSCLYYIYIKIFSMLSCNFSIFFFLFAAFVRLLELITENIMK